MVPVISDEKIHLIGLIIIHWAQLEHDLQEAVMYAADTTHAVARLAFREPRAHDSVTIIEKLIQARGFEPLPKLKDFKVEVRALEETRNKLAHGTWKTWPTKTGAKDYRTLLVVTDGHWEDGRQERFGMKGRVPKKVINGATDFTVSEAEDLLRRIMRAWNDLRWIRHSLSFLRPASPSKPAEQSPRKGMPETGRQ